MTARLAWALSTLVACGRLAPGEPSPGSPPTGQGGTGPTVQVWLTTASGSKLLSREPDARFDTGAPPATITRIAVDEGTRYQEMVGFGAAITDASAWLLQNRMTAAQRDALLQEVFGRDPGIGLSFTRLTIGASDFSLHQYSYDDMPAGQTDSTLAHFSIDSSQAYVLPVVQRALAINPRLMVMASPWSPPGWMKTTGSLIQGTLRPEAYGPLAEYFRRYIEAYGAAGVPIQAITVQNEPAYEPADYPGMRLDPPARAGFVGKYLGPLFARNGIHTLILDGDHNWDQPQSPLQVLADSVAPRYIAGVAWHCYAGDVSAQTTVHDAHPDKDAYFTECSGGEWSPNFADNLKWFVQTLIIGATRGWAKGVILWNLALDEHYGPHTGGCGNCRGVVTIDSVSGAVTRNVEYYTLAHASRFVRPGAWRIAS
ncbi:MAG TPA: hypothetical protein VFD76_05430, partial [Gemmatimonadales bacterium]|nr:hypothetical protein [Gemmatimonadales bacterium]